MTVLTILGLLLAIAVVIAVITMVNEYSIKKYHYQFFNWGNLVVVSLGYLSIFYGDSWYDRALKSSGDVLNGQLLIAIGVIMVVGMFIYHIRRTGFFFGVFFSIVQFVIYLPTSFLAFFALIILLAWLSDTKPVINLN